MAAIAHGTHEVEDWLDRLDPAALKLRDAKHLRSIIAARQDVEASDATLTAVVAAARADGESWAVIGAALGITRQAAQQRFKGKL